MIWRPSALSICPGSGEVASGPQEGGGHVCGADLLGDPHIPRLAAVLCRPGRGRHPHVRGSGGIHTAPR